MPARADATMSGHMRMDGTAYYSLDDAMLLALDATLTIVAQLHDGTRNVAGAHRLPPFHSRVGRARHAGARERRALKRPDQLHLQRMAERRLAQFRQRREREMILVAVDEHLDAALHAAGLLDVLRELSAKIRVRIAQDFRVVRIVGQALATQTPPSGTSQTNHGSSLWRYPMSTSGIARARIEVREETAHRIRVERDFRRFDGVPWARLLQ